MEWISVNDRVPPSASYETCKEYLIFIGYIEKGYWYNNKWTSDVIAPYREFNATHWMPFPEPPKEE